MTEFATFSCDQCGAKGQRHAGRIARYRREGRAIYCGKTCQSAAWRAANPVRARDLEYARRQRPEVREKINTRTLDYYYRNREVALARCKEYRKANPEKVRAAVNRWLTEHPDNTAVYAAKSILTKRLGLRWCDIPGDLAEAVAEQVKITRWVREQRAASGMEARRAAAENTDAVHDSPTAESGDAQ